MSDKTPEQAFAEALVEFQADAPAIVKAASGQRAKYADLTSVVKACQGKLDSHGFSFTAFPTMTEHGFVLRYTLWHIGGHKETGEYPLPYLEAGSQGIGSAITYARRYAFLAATNLAPEGDDDDGQAATDAREDALPRAPRTRGATTRKSAEDLQKEDDPWATATPAEPTRVTDGAWIEGFRRRVAAAGKPSELRGLQEEANVQWAEHKLSREDAAALKREVGEREKELTAEPVPA